MGSEPAIGDVLLGRYELAEEIGRGGFGVVYRAKQLGMNRDVAVKLLHEKGDEEMRERFKREAQMARNLNHPHTIRQYEFGETEDGLLYLVLEFLDGVNLVEAIANDGALGDDRVRHIAEGILKSLGEAHSQGIVHRDLKPANIMICNIFGETDYPKVLDFGIAKTIHGNTDLTQAGVALGSPKYMAPEVLQGLQPTPAADVYSIAITLSEAIIGRPLLDVANSVEAARLQLSPSPLPVPDELRSSSLYPWLSIALKKEPSERFQNAAEMLDHLHVPAARLAGRGADVPAGVDDNAPTGRFAAAPTTEDARAADDPDMFARTEAFEAVVGPSDTAAAPLAIGAVQDDDDATEMISLDEFENRFGSAPTDEANPALVPTAEALEAVAPTNAATERNAPFSESDLAAAQAAQAAHNAKMAQEAEAAQAAQSAQPDRQQQAFQSSPPGELGMIPGIGQNAPPAGAQPDGEDSTEFLDISSLAPTVTAEEKKSQTNLFLALGGIVVIGLLALGGLGGFLVYMSGDKTAADAATPATATEATSTEKVAVKIFSSPEGAAVVIDGQEKAKTPAHFRIAAGSLPKKVELKLPGYQTASVELTSDGKNVFDIKLESSGEAVDEKKGSDEAGEADGDKPAVEEAPAAKPEPTKPRKPRKRKPKPKPETDNSVDIW